jgi:hypothetical protein
MTTLQEKGNKFLEVPISPDLMEEINIHLKNRNLGRVGYVLEDTPIIGKLRGSCTVKSLDALTKTHDDLKGAVQRKDSELS